MLSLRLFTILGLACFSAASPTTTTMRLSLRQVIPSPTDQGDCVRFEDLWRCDGVTAMPTIQPSIGTPNVNPSIPPSPTNSGVCTLHIDHYHCEGEGPADAAAEASQSIARGLEPTGRGKCIAHLDHWDCELSASGEAETISEEGGEGCIQHGTHFHCPPGVQASCDAVDLGDYNLNLHIVALFVLLVASFVGVTLPIFVSGKTTPMVQWLFFILKHFGTGIIISTAFIHLLMHAFVMFANECLGELTYEATSPAIVMAAVIAVFLVDFFAARWMASRKLAAAREAQLTAPARSSESASDSNEKTAAPAAAPHAHALGEFGHDHAGGDICVYDGASRQAHWDVQLLEAGVIFHSIMIGVTLGAQAGPGFIPTFCAIVFHQLFEGLGLGARIATLQWPNGGAWKKWVMCTVYTLVTPVGIAIGMGVHESFNLNGKAAILVIGVLDSVSAGILLYAGLCQLLMMEWVRGEMRDAPLSKVAIGLFSMFWGLFAMSLIGKWA